MDFRQILGQRCHRCSDRHTCSYPAGSSRLSARRSSKSVGTASSRNPATPCFSQKRTRPTSPARPSGCASSDRAAGCKTCGSTTVRLRRVLPGGVAESRLPVVRRLAPGLCRSPIRTSRASGLVFELSDSINHGCLSEVWFITMSMMTRISRFFASATRRSKSAMVPYCGIDADIVRDVVAEIDLRRGIDRRQPDGIHAECLQVIEPLGDAVQVADAVAIRILKAARINLVDDRMLPPDVTLLAAAALLSAFPCVFLSAAYPVWLVTATLRPNTAASINCSVHRPSLQAPADRTSRPASKPTTTRDAARRMMSASNRVVRFPRASRREPRDRLGARPCSPWSTIVIRFQETRCIGGFSDALVDKLAPSHGTE